uniref:Uncharacterized protein n=1 Tax=Oryza rufipogon TaxID=4529 RepID=A0A0E0Q3N5_ORYRU
MCREKQCRSIWAEPASMFELASFFQTDINCSDSSQTSIYIHHRINPITVTCTDLQLIKIHCTSTSKVSSSRQDVWCHCAQAIP